MQDFDSDRALPLLPVEKFYQKREEYLGLGFEDTIVTLEQDGDNFEYAGRNDKKLKLGIRVVFAPSLPIRRK